MKKLVLFLVLTVFVLASSAAFAQTKVALGNGNFALKVDYFSFMDDAFDGVDLEDGIYIGLEGYASLFFPNLYFGIESGWAGSESDGEITVLGISRDAELDVDYVPIEFNAKYVFEINPALTFDLGAGLSYNYFGIDMDVEDFSADEDDWVFGGQVFADVNYKVCNWFFGVNAKYQFTDDLEFTVRDQDIDTDINAENFRVGGQVGVMF